MLDLVASAPSPRRVVTSETLSVATYEFGDPNAPPVLAVHGFASGALANWHVTGWTRDLTRAGYRVIAMDQRGHGRSDKPRHPSDYSMAALVDDVIAVLDAYLIDEVSYLGYSLGARVGWHTALHHPGRIRCAVLGGIPDGQPLRRVRVDQARALVDDGIPVEDRLTAGYITMAESVGGNELGALIALVEGMQDGEEVTVGETPRVPVLFATGSEDRILPASRSLAEATEGALFFEIPGRTHFNAPTSGAFRKAAIRFLDDHR